MTDLDADIAVLGSGFAGSLTALLLARQGFSVVVVDRATHPRFAIGESSTPTADMILRDLSMCYDLPRLLPLTRYGTWKEAYPNLGVGRKRGFSYFHHEAGQAFTPRPDHANELLVAASSEDHLSDTHWLRADVDAFLAGEAQCSGVVLLEGTEITTLQHASRWRIEGYRQEERVRLAAGFVIDATGAGSLLARTLGVPDATSLLRTRSRAVFTHLEGAARWQDVYRAAGAATSAHPYACDDAALHHVLDGAWMWVLRFDDGLVSAGLVLDAERHPLPVELSPEAEWHAWLARYPAAAEQLGHARLAEMPGRWIRTGPLQRRAARAAGAHWAMLPHTAGFIDPLHSTGIAHSLSGVERLTNLLAHHWTRPSLDAALTSYSQDVLDELDFIDVLVATCYASMNTEPRHRFRLFTASTMLYFAATIAYERHRAEPGGEPRRFLCADDPTLRALSDEALAMLRQGVDAADYEAFVERGIRPFNTAGLFHPPVPNMYHHTAARV